MINVYFPNFLMSVSRLTGNLYGLLNHRPVRTLLLDKNNEYYARMPSFKSACKSSMYFILIFACLRLIYKKTYCKPIVVKPSLCSDEETLSQVPQPSIPHPPISLHQKKVVPVSVKQPVSVIQQEEVVPSVKEEDLNNIPLLGFGTFIGLEHQKIEDPKQRQQIVEEAVYNALKAGYRHIDCAAEYGNLEWIGNALKKAFKTELEGGLGLKRSQIWITSKDENPSAKKLDETLKALGVEKLDLYLLHYPHQDMEAIWQEMNALVEQGLVEKIGVSNFYQGQLERLLKICQEQDLLPPYANEIEISPWLQESDFLAYCQTKNIRLIGYSPLGYGNSSGVLATFPILTAADKLQATAAQIALAWNMARGVAIIPSSRKEEHILSNYKSLELIPTLAADKAFLAEMQEADLNLSSTEMSEKYKQESAALG